MTGAEFVVVLLCSKQRREGIEYRACTEAVFDICTQLIQRDTVQGLCVCRSVQR